MYKYSKCCFILSVLIFLLSLSSLVLGSAANKVQYGVIANLVPMMMPVLAYFGITKRTWGKEALRVQCIGASCYLICIIIVDAVILSALATVQRYCYGDLKTHCIISVNSGYNYECESSETSQSNENTFVTCPDQATLLLYILSLVTNMCVAVLLVPYLVLCQTLKGMLFRIFIQEHVSIFDQNALFPGQLGDDQPIPFTTLIVKTGNVQNLAPGDEGKSIDDVKDSQDPLFVPPTPDAS